MCRCAVKKLLTHPLTDPLFHTTIGVLDVLSRSVCERIHLLACRASDDDDDDDIDDDDGGTGC